jgi:hypothetical protein
MPPIVPQRHSRIDVPARCDEIIAATGIATGLHRATGLPKPSTVRAQQPLIV